MRIKLRCFELFAEKLEIGWGKAFFGYVPSKVFTLAMLRQHPFSRYLQHFRHVRSS